MSEPINEPTEKLWPNYLHEREIGRLMNQVEFLRDAVKTAQMDITNALIQRKDLQHALEDVFKSFETLDQHFDVVDAKISDMSIKFAEHIRNDRPIHDVVITKIGKLVLAGLATGGGIILLELFDKFRDAIFQHQ